MSQWVVLNFGGGNCNQGFSLVTAQLWQLGCDAPIQFTGALPPATELISLYQQWQQMYEALYANLGWRRIHPTSLRTAPDFEFEDNQVTNVSQAAFDRLSNAVQQQLNRWLSSERFHNIERKLRTQLAAGDEARLIIAADDSQVLRLPWMLWHFFEDYPHIEVALSPPQYARSLKHPTPPGKKKVNILAVFGDRQGIDIAQDQSLLEQLPNVELTFLVEPSSATLNQQLWEGNWDIFFFAGHSSSQGQGMMQVNSTSSLTISQLKLGLRRAITHGLKLAIFNSCDGLGLALDMADLQLPQVIVMREPVPDRVAQEFLKYFLTAFSSGHSLYTAVREAREKLQILEAEFPCATWLPVICQNPAEVPTCWQDWYEANSQRQWRLPSRHQWQTLLTVSLITSGLVMGIRWLGLLQTWELAAYDQFMRWRPAEPADTRIMVITVNQTDIDAQGNEPRKGSLSDRTLNQLLKILEESQAELIGLDIYRDFPVDPKYPELAQRMRQNDRLLAICKRPAPHDANAISINPPPEIPPHRLGFSDGVEDDDGINRRQLISFSAPPLSNCTPSQAFSAMLAFRYLAQRGVQGQITPTSDLQLGETIFPKLKPRFGGYQPVDARGIQVMLNYRNYPGEKTTQVSLTQVLNGQVNAQVFQNRIVLIGTIFPENNDYWPTPYGASFAKQVPGVFLQAQEVSQLLAAALDQRPLIWVWTPVGEFVWVWGWAFLGGLFVWWLTSPRQRLLVGVISIPAISGTCFLIFLGSGWIPMVPTILASGLTIGYLASVMPRDNDLTSEDV